MFKLILSLPFGKLEKQFESSQAGRLAAGEYVKHLRSKGQQVLDFKIVELAS